MEVISPFPSFSLHHPSCLTISLTTPRLYFAVPLSGRCPPIGASVLKIVLYTEIITFLWPSTETDEIRGKFLKSKFNSYLKTLKELVQCSTIINNFDSTVTVELNIAVLLVYERLSLNFIIVEYVEKL